MLTGFGSCMNKGGTAIITTWYTNFWCVMYVSIRNCVVSMLYYLTCWYDQYSSIYTGFMHFCMTWLLKGIAQFLVYCLQVFPVSYFHWCFKAHFYIFLKIISSNKFQLWKMKWGAYNNLLSHVDADMKIYMKCKIVELQLLSSNSNNTKEDDFIF